MARKTSVKAQQSESESQSNKVAVEQTKAVVVDTNVVAKKKRATKAKKDGAVVAPTPAVSSLPVVQEDAGAPVEKKQRVVPTKDSVLASFQSLIESVEHEIETIRSEGSGKTVGSIKFLRSMIKQMKVLKAQSTRVIGKRGGGGRKKSDPDAVPNTSSGFLKPVEISKEIAKFAGWGPTDMKSRVDVTKYLCAYIKDNNLQNEEDRRQIKPDNKLSKLLGYDEKTSGSPLTYFHLQKLLKPHFPKAVTVA